MKYKSITISTFALVFALSLSSAGSIFAQDQQERRKISPEKEQMYVISAKAGGVSYASGEVQVDRAATKTRRILAKGDEIQDGDIISVGQTGNAEILLNPGSYLRLAENTNLQFADTDLESLLIKMKNGSALIEALAVGGNGADITIVTPQATVSLEKSGIYRLNVSPAGTEVLVWKGAASVGDQIVRSGQKAVLQKGAAATIAKFDKDDSRDSLDIWSKDRAKELAKLNTKVKRRDLSTAFYGMSAEFAGYYRFGGFWAFNRFTGTYCYIPYGFGYGFWNSPYGYYYNRGVYWDYNYYPNTRTPVVVTSNPSRVGRNEGHSRDESSPSVFSPPPPTYNPPVVQPGPGTPRAGRKEN